SHKRDELAVIDRKRRTLIDRVKLPQVVEGVVVTPDGETVIACAQTAAEFYVIDAGSHAIRRHVSIEGANGEARQMRRARVSPDGKYLLVSSHVDCHAAIYSATDQKLIATFPTKKAPMGFGFAPDGTRAYICCHDDAVVSEFELSTGRITREFPTAA